MTTSRTTLRAAAAAALLMVAGGLTTISGTASATTTLPKPTNCPAAYPITSVRTGMTATGYTTERGRTPKPFKVTVLGVLKDALGPGIPMILVRADSPAIRAVGSIWQGMSGSPVYAADGRLLGAVSRGLTSFGGPSRTAGLTPAAAMYKLFSLPTSTASAASSASPIMLSYAQQKTLVSSGAATARAAASGLSPLLTPVVVSGVGPRVLANLRQQVAASGEPLNVMAGSAAPTSTSLTTSVTPGTPIAAALSYGSFTMAGIGTVTAVCKGKVIAFGHPMQGLGATTESAHLATVMYVQDDLFNAPYVMANVGGRIGIVDQDRLVGIRARLGVYPKAAVVKGSVTSSTGLRKWVDTRVPVQEWVADAAANTLYGAVFATIWKDTAARTWVRWSASGHRADGSLWTYARTDRTEAGYDISYATGNLLWDPLTRVRDNVAENVTTDSVAFYVSAAEGFSDYTVTGITPLAQTTYAPGDSITISVPLRPYKNVAGMKTVDVTIPVPADAPDGDATISVTGGAQITLPDPITTTFADVLAQLAQEPRNDVLVTTLTLSGGTTVTVKTMIGQFAIGSASQTVTIATPAPPTP